MSAMSTLDWVGVVGPFVVFFVMLIGYYVLEGRREQRLREQYESEGNRAN